MIKAIKNIFLILVISIIAYAGFWYYKASKIESFLEKNLKIISKHIIGNNSDIYFAQSNVTGFPFNFNMEINKPKLLINGRKHSFEISTQDSLIIHADFSGNNFKFILPKEFTILPDNSASVSEFKLKYNVNPTLTMDLVENNNLFKIFSTEPFDLYSKTLDIKEFTYKDGGFEIFNLNSEKQISSAESVWFSIRAKNHELESDLVDLNINIKNANIDDLYRPNAITQRLGLVNFTADISFSGFEDVYSDKDSKIQARTVNFSSEFFGLSLKGDIDFVVQDPFPFGHIQLEITKYKNMVDYKTAFLNDFVRDSIFPIFYLNESKIASLKDFLYNVASERSNNDDNLLITLSRKEGESLFIGDKSISEILGLFRKNMHNQNHINDVIIPQIEG